MGFVGRDDRSGGEAPGVVRGEGGARRAFRAGGHCRGAGREFGQRSRGNKGSRLAGAIVADDPGRAAYDERRRVDGRGVGAA